MKHNQWEVVVRNDYCANFRDLFVGFHHRKKQKKEKKKLNSASWKLFAIGQGFLYSQQPPFSFSNNLSLKNKVSHYWFVAYVKICAIIKLKMHHYPKVNMYLFFFLKNIQLSPLKKRIEFTFIICYFFILFLKRSKMFSRNNKKKINFKNRPLR